MIGAGAAVLALAGCQTGPRGPVEPAGIEPPPVPAGQETNEVAVIVPLTGPDAGVGTSIANAARLALLDTGEQSIRIQVYDSARPGGAAAAVARRAGIPVIAFSNDEGVAGDGVYIMGFTPDQSIGRVVS